MVEFDTKMKEISNSTLIIFIIVLKQLTLRCELTVKLSCSTAYVNFTALCISKITYKIFKI